MRQLAPRESDSVAERCRRLSTMLVNLSARRFPEHRCPLNCRGTTFWGVGTITANARPARKVTMGMRNQTVDVPPRINAGFKVARLFSTELRQNDE